MNSAIRSRISLLAFISLVVGMAVPIPSAAQRDCEKMLNNIFPDAEEEKGLTSEDQLLQLMEKKKAEACEGDYYYPMCYVSQREYDDIAQKRFTTGKGNVREEVEELARTRCRATNVNYWAGVRPSIYEAVLARVKKNALTAEAAEAGAVAAKQTAARRAAVETPVPTPSPETPSASRPATFSKSSNVTKLHGSALSDLGKYLGRPSKLVLDNQAVQIPFRTLLGPDKYQAFRQRVTIRIIGGTADSNPFDEDANWYFGSGLSENDGRNGAAFAIHKASGQVYAAIVFNKARVEYYGFKHEGEIPDPFSKWLRITFLDSPRRTIVPLSREQDTARVDSSVSRSTQRSDSSSGRSEASDSGSGNGGNRGSRSSDPRCRALQNAYDSAGHDVQRSRIADRMAQYGCMR